MPKFKTAILMSHYNGKKYIDEQLESLIDLNSSESEFHIFIRDDGSSEKESKEKLLETVAKYDNISLTQGENLGVVSSFFTLLQQVDGYDYYAFCDQDDYWYKHKLTASISSLSSVAGPALFCSSYHLVDENLHPLVNTEEKQVFPSFYNAMFKNFCTGCTCVISKELREIILQSPPDILPMHDWWLLLSAYCCGTVIYSNEPLIMYRQHSRNVVGGIDTFSKKLKRFIRNISEDDVTRSNLARDLLKHHAQHICNEYKTFLTDMLDSKHSMKSRFRLLFNNNVAYQNRLDTISAKILMLLGRY